MTSTIVGLMAFAAAMLALVLATHAATSSWLQSLPL